MFFRIFSNSYKFVKKKWHFFFIQTKWFPMKWIMVASKSEFHIKYFYFPLYFSFRFWNVHFGCSGRFLSFFIFKLYCVSNFYDYVSCHRQLEEMGFCFQNCSGLLWEKIVLVIEKNFWNSRLKARISKHFEINRKIHSNRERYKYNFWNRMIFLLVPGGFSDLIH